MGATTGVPTDFSTSERYTLFPMVSPALQFLLPAAARASLERMLEIYRRLPAGAHGPHLVAGALQRLARFHAGRGQYAQAEAYWQASLSLSAQQGDERALHSQASVQTTLGWIRMAQGEPEAALGYFEAARRTSEDAYEGLLRAGARAVALAPELLDLAYAHWRLGDAEGARRHYQEAMALLARSDRDAEAYLADLESRLAAYDWPWEPGARGAAARGARLANRGDARERRSVSPGNGVTGALTLAADRRIPRFAAGRATRPRSD